jgi:hypothetical protein
MNISFKPLYILVLIGACLLIVFSWLLIFDKSDNSKVTAAPPATPNEKQSNPLSPGYHPGKRLKSSSRVSESNQSQDAASSQSQVSSPNNTLQLSSLGVSPSSSTSTSAVKVEGTNRPLIFNPQGSAQRIYLGPKQTVQIALSYPKSMPGDLLSVQTEDGGHLNAKQTVAQIALNDSRQLNFSFSTAQDPGIYRVTIRNGFEEKHLNFWVGPEPSLNIPK